MYFISPSRPASLLAILLILAASGTSGCDGGGARATPGFESASETLTKSQLAREIGLTWERDVSLEESRRVVNVEIAVRPAPAGRFVVADAQEAQVRRYDETGDLDFAFGAEGDGPLEFDAPSAALQLRGDTVLAADLQARLYVTHPPTDSLLSTIHVPLGPIYDADLIDHRHVLLSGRSAEGPERLHVVDYRAGEIVRSFFPPPVGDEASVNAVGLTNSTVWGDTIATVFALSDTVYYFGLDGKKLRQRPFRSEHFRAWETAPPTRTRASARSWYRSFSYATEVFRPTDSLTVIQYQDRGEDMTPRWRLVGIGPDGATTFDLVDTPRLLAARPDDGELVFVAPGSLTPNRWSVASLR